MTSKTKEILNFIAQAIIAVIYISTLYYIFWHIAEFIGTL